MIDLPATPQTVLAKVIVPALALLPAHMDTPEARGMLVVIGLQEEGENGLFTTRQQIHGPAHGLWQNERPVQQELLKNRVSAAEVHALCKSRAVAPVASDMYWALRTDDVFAAGIARLILWCDHDPLPGLGDIAGAFQYYVRVWGPGAYTRGNAAQKAAILKRFDLNYETAIKAVKGPCA